MKHATHRILRFGVGLVGVCVVGSALLCSAQLSSRTSQEVELTVRSSNPKVTEIFAWAKEEALRHVQKAGREGPLNVDERNPKGNGSAVYAPTYWAGYSARSGYYSRDFAHQLVGAHLLGLDLENKTMLRSFAASATSEHKFFPVWAINFDARTYLSIDYVSSDYFVRELPAVFELVEKAATAYKWTGDEEYIHNPVLWAFYEHTLGEFVDLHSSRDPERPVRVAQGTGRNIFLGTASYNEAGDEVLLEAGDSIAAQYQAYLSLAYLASAKGDYVLQRSSQERADILKSYFNTVWSVLPGSSEVVFAYDVAGNPLTGWGKETSMFLPLKGILESGERNDNYLAFINDRSEDPTTRAPNIESLTYLPDIFLRYQENDLAWKWMRHIFNLRNEPHAAAHEEKNGDYPEVSFTLVSQIVAGLLGISPNAPQHAVSTLSHLPEDIDWLEADAVPFGKGHLRLLHEGLKYSSLTNRGDETITWKAQFAGEHQTLVRNGRRERAVLEQDSELPISSLVVEAGPGETVEVSVY